MHCIDIWIHIYKLQYQYRTWKPCVKPPLSLVYSETSYLGIKMKPAKWYLWSSLVYTVHKCSRSGVINSNNKHKTLTLILVINSRKCDPQWVPDLRNITTKPLLVPKRQWVKAWQISFDGSTSTWPLPAPVNTDNVLEVMCNSLWHCSLLTDFTTKMAHTIQRQQAKTSPVTKKMKSSQGKLVCVSPG